MSILVTGGAGFIGSHLCESFLRLGKRVVAIDNFDPFYSKTIKQANLQHLFRYENFYFFEIDLKNRNAVRKLFRDFRFTRIFHLAGRGGILASSKYPTIYLGNIMKNTLTLLNACKEFDIKIFVNASTSAVYGERKVKLCKEDSSTDEPKSVYAALKKSTELICYAYHHIWGLPIINVRFFSVYGPRGRPDQVIYRFTKMIDNGEEIPWIEPEPARDFTYIDDIIEGLLALLKLRDPSCLSINLGFGKPELISKVIRLVEVEMSKEAKIGKKIIPSPRSDISAIYADNRQARRLLGWRPKIDLATGIKIFVKWYKSNKKQ